MTDAENAQDAMAPLDAIRELLDRVAVVEDHLADVEKSLFHELRDKYAGPCDIGYEDRVLLEVMLRNVTVRQDKGIALK